VSADLLDDMEAELPRAQLRELDARGRGEAVPALVADFA
jgi:hypothetical protein